MSAATVLDSLAILYRHARSLRAGAPIAPADGAAVATALEGFLSKPGAVAMETAFGLGGKDSRQSWPMILRAHVQADLICEYVRLFCPGDIANQSKTAATELARYERRTWPRDRGASGTRESYRGTPRGLLFEIFSFSAGRVPTSPQQIRRILLTHCRREDIFNQATPATDGRADISNSESSKEEKAHAAAR